MYVKHVGVFPRSQTQLLVLLMTVQLTTGVSDLAGQPGSSGPPSQNGSLSGVPNQGPQAFSNAPPGPRPLAGPFQTTAPAQRQSVRSLLDHHNSFSQKRHWRTTESIGV